MAAFPDSVTVYRLRPLTRFLRLRVAQGEETVEFIPSDTLFAALVAVAAEQWGQRAAAALGEAFGGSEPPFLLTGAFPALPHLRFFPRPAAWSPGPGKALKRLRWVSEGLLARLARGEPVKDEDLFPSEGGEEPERTLAKIAPVRLLRAERSQLPRPMQRGDLAAWRLWDAAFQRPAVVVSRGGGRTFLYDIAMARYGPQVSWWAAFAWGARAEETAWPGGPSWRGLIESALRALGDRGIGGMRSRGGGAFQLELDSTPLALSVASAPYVVTLSRYHPRGDELEAGALSDPKAAYRLVTVGGWAAIPGRPDQPRRPIGMVEAGAVLRADGRFPLGTLVDARLNPKDLERFPHPLWRYGLAFPIPWAGLPPASDRLSEGPEGKPESDPEEASDGPVSVADHHPE